MRAGGFTAIGPRDANEDNLFFMEFGTGSLSHGITSFVMVSDGMGGYQCGDVASGLVVAAARSYTEQLLNMTQGNLVDLDPVAALAEIAQNGHDAICAESASRGNAAMGATFVAAFASPTHAWIAHVGDSRAYLMRDGAARQLTKDHSKVGRMLSRGVITEAEAQNHPDRNRIERALGFGNAVPDFNEVELGPRDVLLLCSDGVYTVMNSGQLCDCVLSARDAGKAAEAVVRKALKRGTDDNSTAVVLLGEGLGEATAKTKGRGRTATEVMVPEAKASEANPYEKSWREARGFRTGIIILLAGILIGVIVALTIGALYRPDAAGGGAVAASESKSQEDDVTDERMEDGVSYKTFVVPETPAVELKYVDADGLAELFSYDTFACQEPVTLRPGSSVVASVESFSFNRLQKTYQQLADEYVADLRADVERYLDGATTYGSGLASVCDTEYYLVLLEAIANAGLQTFDDTVAHLVVETLPNANVMAP